MDQDRIPLMRGENRSADGDGSVLAREIGLKAGALIMMIAGTTLSLTNDHHGRVLDFRSSSATTVTIPAGLRADFYCGISQGGAGQVTVTAGDGVTLIESDSQFKTAKQHVMLSLVAFELNIYKLFGKTAA
jgi:hypothetical protein